MEGNNVTGRDICFSGIYKGRNDYVDKWWLMGSFYTPLFIISLYLALVLKLGPGFMKCRKPLKLNTVLVVYNASQAALSLYMFQIGFRYLLKNGVINPSCNTENAEGLKFIEEKIYLFLTAKLSELLDTIFFVLRKKQSQITFLHVYHHSFMFLVTWAVLKYDPSDTAGFFGTCNAFVHIVMYGYYALSAIPNLKKYLWWKKYITALQLAQFAAVMVQMTIQYHVMSCPPSKIFIWAAIMNLALFLYLFSDFYWKSYNRKVEEPLNNGKQEQSYQLDSCDKQSNVTNQLKNRKLDSTKIR